jgi:hypothetical protein
MKDHNAPENQTARRILPIACATALAVTFTGALPQPARADQIANELIPVNAKTGKRLTIAGGHRQQRSRFIDATGGAKQARRQLKEVQKMGEAAGAIEICSSE